MDTALWLALRPFVNDMVAAGARATTYSARELYAVVTPLAVWMHTKVGMDLDRETALNPYTIDRFVMVGLAHYTKAGRGTMRSRLRRLSEALVPELGEAAKERSLGKSARVAPYSDAEIVELRAWARALPPRMQENAERLLALGFGAGLQGSEVGNVRGKDVVVTPEGVTVMVDGAKAREVPVLRDWEAALRAAQAAVEPDAYVFRVGRQTAHRNAVTNFVERHGVGVQLQARRMRATWIVHHLNAGTPVTALLPAAGLSSAEGLDPFMAWAAAPADAASLLRAAGRSVSSSS